MRGAHARTNDTIWVEPQIGSDAITIDAQANDGRFISGTVRVQDSGQLEELINLLIDGGHILGWTTHHTSTRRKS